MSSNGHLETLMKLFNQEIQRKTLARKVCHQETEEGPLVRKVCHQETRWSLADGACHTAVCGVWGPTLLSVSSPLASVLTPPLLVFLVLLGNIYTLVYDENICKFPDGNVRNIGMLGLPSYSECHHFVLSFCANSGT